MRHPPALGVSAALLLSVGACQMTTQHVNEATDTCGAVALQNLVGQRADPATLPDVPMRIIAPGMAVTMDYNPHRLNVETDSVGIIARLSCG